MAEVLKLKVGSFFDPEAEAGKFEDDFIIKEEGPFFNVYPDVPNFSDFSPASFPSRGEAEAYIRKTALKFANAFLTAKIRKDRYGF